ncbi:MAG: DUF1585 domain-containing protein [Planctomycetaceae bacterium]
MDASGDLPSGDKFSGPAELMSIIRSRQEKFSRTLTERLLVYALGRGLEYYDKCAVDQAGSYERTRESVFCTCGRNRDIRCFPEEEFDSRNCNRSCTVAPVLSFGFSKSAALFILPRQLYRSAGFSQPPSKTKPQRRLKSALQTD